MRKRMTLLALTAVLALGAGGCASRREGSVGILYRITGGKNSVVLLGSIHVGSEEMYPMGRHILDALEDADVLAFECDTRSAEAQAVYAEMMRCDDGETLGDLVSGETFELVRQAAQKTGYRIDSLNALKPWAAMSMLNTEATAATLGAKNARAASSLGVEEQVRALGEGRPEVWLDTIRDELEVLDSLSPALQESLLRSTCRIILDPQTVTGMDASMDQWPQWWREGDADAFAAAYLEGMEAEEEEQLAREYHRALITERNAGMARRIAQWLEEGEDHSYFVTLGLLHLVLPGDSVPDELEAMGYTVERILPENV